MTGPVTIDATTPGYGALMATLLAVQPVQTGTPGGGHSANLTPFDARVIARIAAVIVTCPTCGHATGCDCDCCRYPLPAGTGLKAGAR